jgi:hypothetical protein
MATINAIVSVRPSIPVYLFVCPYIYLSVCMDRSDSHLADFRESIYFGIFTKNLLTQYNIG